MAGFQVTLTGRFTPSPDNLVQRAYNDTQDTKATGFELDLTANLTRSWSLMLNAALPKSAISNSLPRYAAVVAKNRAAWTAAANNPANPNARQMQEYLADIDGRFALRADGMPIVGTTDFSAKLFTRYRFARGALKGAFVGGGATMEGDTCSCLMRSTPAASTDFREPPRFCAVRGRPA